MNSRCLTSLCFLLSACASDQYLRSEGHRAFDRADYIQAAEAYSRAAAEPSTNQVLFLFDQGTALFAARRYQEAIDVFLRAEKLTQIKDYTSLGEEVGTLATSGNVRGYKGEDFEKVLVNVYLALSFAALGNLEEAQVEARKINLILHRMITDGKRNYEESPFARYLSGLLWEAGREWNSAYIDYKLAYQLDPKFPGLGADLLALSARLGFDDEYKKWSQVFSGVMPRRVEKSQGELIVFFEQGRSPRKIPRDGQDSSLPRYVPRFSQTFGARLVVNGQAQGTLFPALDIETTSIRYLEDRMGRMAAAKLAGAVMKGALAAGVARLAKDEDAGWLTFFALMATDRADLRSWLTLPAHLQMIRVPLSAGSHHVILEALDAGGQPVRQVDLGTVSIKPGSKVFLVGR